MAEPQLDYAVFNKVSHVNDVKPPGAGVFPPHVIELQWFAPVDVNDFSKYAIYIRFASSPVGDLILFFNGYNVYKKNYFVDLTDFYNVDSTHFSSYFALGNNDKELLDKVYNKEVKLWFVIETFKNDIVSGSDHIFLNISDEESGIGESIIKPNRTIPLRKYRKIFTGTNQEFGYDKPILTYSANTTQLTFLKDKTTYFHYSRDVETMDVSASNLIECGAIPGNVPYRSDRIYKYQGGYENDIWWGNSSVENGIWLCAWLSGNILNNYEKPIWIDRWYKPGYLTRAYIDDTYEDNCNTSSDPIVWDEPSKLTFESGGWYKYDHLGEISNTTIVNYLSGSLLFHLDDWQEITIDKSGNGNNGFIEYYNENMINPFSISLERESDFSLDLTEDKQCCFVRYTSSVSPLCCMSLNFWVKADDWEHIYGNHILSNSHRGGWYVKYDNGFFTPSMTIYGTNGKFLCFNTLGSLFLAKNLNVSSNIQSIAIDSDFYVWVVENSVQESYKHVYKMDYTGDVLVDIKFPPDISLSGVYIDIDDMVNVYSSLGTVSAFNTYNGLFESDKLFTKYDNALLKLDGTVCLDNSGIIWEILDSNSIYRDETTKLLTVQNAVGIDCDSEDNIWILHGEKSYSKYNRFGVLLKTGIIGSAIISGKRRIFFTYENGLNYVWFYQGVENTIYKYDSDGNFVFKIELDEYDVVFNGNGDCTGYNHYRINKFINTINRVPKIESGIYLYDSTQVKSGVNIPIKITFTMDVSALADSDWHMFSIVYEYKPTTNDGKLYFYLDSMLKQTVSDITSAYQIYYQYENSLYIGANAGKIKSLGYELNSNQLYFKGSFDDVRLYNCVLNNSDIRHIYLEKYGFRNINWNMKTSYHDYAEEIVRWFKQKIPGMKSQFYNIKIIGSQIYDENTRGIIEGIIKDVINKTNPMHTELFRIIWE